MNKLLIACWILFQYSTAETAHIIDSLKQKIVQTEDLNEIVYCEYELAIFTIQERCKVNS